MGESLYEEIIKQLPNEKLDQDSLNRIFAQKEAEWQTARKELVQQFAEFHAKLTPDQRNRLVGMIAMDGWKSKSQ